MIELPRNIAVVSVGCSPLSSLSSCIIYNCSSDSLVSKLKTPLQIGRHLVRAFEAGFEAGVKPIDATVVEGVLSARIDDLEPQLTRHGYARKLVRIWPKLVRMVGQKLQASENDSTFPAVDPRPAVRYAIHYH